MSMEESFEVIMYDFFSFFKLKTFAVRHKIGEKKQTDNT